MYNISMDIASLISITEKFYLEFGYLIVFFSSLIEISPMGWIIPGGGLLALGGFFAYGKVIFLIGVIAFGTLGAWITFIIAYLLGKKTGYWFVKKFKQKKNAERAKILLEKNGPVILTTSMLANLTRFWVAYVAGNRKYNFVRFLFYSLFASLTWVSLFSVLGYLAGSERQNLESALGRLGFFGWGFLIISLAVIYITIRKEFGINEKNTGN